MMRLVSFRKPLRGADLASTYTSRVYGGFPASQSPMRQCGIYSRINELVWDIFLGVSLNFFEEEFLLNGWRKI